MDTESLLGRLATVHTRADLKPEWKRQFQGIIRGVERNLHVGGFLLELTESTGMTDYLEVFRNVPAGGLLMVQTGERVMVSVDPLPVWVNG
jgi:hypothetical protein